MSLTAKRTERCFYRLSAVILCQFVLMSAPIFVTGKTKLKNGTVIAKTSGAVTLKPEGVRVAVELVPEERQKNQSLSARIAKLGPVKSFYLVFKNLQTDKQPGELYHVYLNVEPGKTPNTSDQPDGVLNFYNARKEPRPTLFFSFDVTEVLQKLSAQRQLTESLTLTIIPAEPPAAGAVPTIGQIELVEQ
jgi:hypothetical protein